MAAKNTETEFEGSTNTKSAKVSGTLVMSGGATSGIIIPGYDANSGDSLLTANGTNVARTIREPKTWGFTNNVSANPHRVVKTFDTTAQAWKLTVTCTANDAFDYWVEGKMNGSVDA